jgi:hypothetical protein
LEQIVAGRTTSSESFQALALVGRVLILLTALLLGVMPWTEYFWDFNNFLRGGQDLELGLLSIALSSAWYWCYCRTASSA